MKNRLVLTSRILALALLAAAPCALAQSAVPGSMSYQGRISDASGNLVGSPAPVNRTVIFRVWDSPSATAPANLLYSEQQVVTIASGEFNVLVGQGAPVGTEPKPAFDSVFNGAERFLGVTVDDGTAAADPEITPRQQLVSSAFAFRAKTAEEVPANAITSSMLAAGAVTTNSIAANAIDNTKLATGAALANIAANSINSSKLAAGAVTSDSIAAGAVTTASIAASAIDISKLAAAVVESLCPPGTISAYGGTTAPPGWLLCDGTAVSRSTYPALYATIGLNYGNGGGDATKFSVPDLRGMFLRGMSGAAGATRDPDVASRTSLNGGASGNNLGSNQGYAFQYSSHNHGFSDNYFSSLTAIGLFGGVFPLPVTGGAASPGNYGAKYESLDNAQSNQLWVTGNATSGTQIGTSTETRPSNIYVNYIIKH